MSLLTVFTSSVQFNVSLPSKNISSIYQNLADPKLKLVHNALTSLRTLNDINT